MVDIDDLLPPPIFATINNGIYFHKLIIARASECLRHCDLMNLKCRHQYTDPSHRPNQIGGVLL